MSRGKAGIWSNRTSPEAADLRWRLGSKDGKSVGNNAQVGFVSSIRGETLMAPRAYRSVENYVPGHLHRARQFAFDAMTPHAAMTTRSLQNFE